MLRGLSLRDKDRLEHAVMMTQLRKRGRRWADNDGDVVTQSVCRVTRA